jgi:hypothetical protein
MKDNVYQEISDRKAKGKKSFAVLLDPDNVRAEQLPELAEKASNAGVDFWLQRHVMFAVPLVSPAQRLQGGDG